MNEEDNKTLWCGNLPEQVTEELLYELFLQAGPLEKVRIPKDRDGRQKNFAFITFCHEVSVPYAMHLFRGTALYHRTLSLQCRGRLVNLPPPIRCYGPELSESLSQADVKQQFTEMTERIREEDRNALHSMRQTHDFGDKLVQASLQGNWSLRHHPYRSKERQHQGKDHRSRDWNNYKDDHNDNGYHNSHSSNRRERRNYHRGNYYRRE